MKIKFNNVDTVEIIMFKVYVNMYTSDIQKWNKFFFLQIYKYFT